MNAIIFVEYQYTKLVNTTNTLLHNFLIFWQLYWKIWLNRNLFEFFGKFSIENILMWIL